MAVKGTGRPVAVLKLGFLLQVRWLQVSSASGQPLTFTLGVNHMGVKMNISDTEFLVIASGSTSRFELWRKVLNATNSKTLVEVGVWRGDFAK